MSTTTLAPERNDSATKDDAMVHVVCMCSPDLGLCGKDLTGVPWTTDAECECVVCADLEWKPCPRCGA